MRKLYTLGLFVVLLLSLGARQKAIACGAPPTVLSAYKLPNNGGFVVTFILNSMPQVPTVVLRENGDPIVSWYNMGLMNPQLGVPITDTLNLTFTGGPGAGVQPSNPYIELAIGCQNPPQSGYIWSAPFTLGSAPSSLNCSVLANTMSAPTQPVNAGDNFTVENTSHNAPSGATYSWNFSGANVVSGSGKGPYTLNFSTPGTYTISVSYSAGNCSTATTSRTITVNQACDVVTGYTAGTTTSNTAVITWTNSGSNLGYFINYRVVGSNAWQGVQTAANANNRTLSGLQPSSNYEFIVRRVCASGVLSRINGETPGTFSTNTDPNPCAAPTNFQQVTSTVNSATVSWSPVAGASSYVVHIRRSGTSAYTGIFNKTATATSHTFTGLMANTSYDYMIYTGCSGIRSAQSTTSGITDIVTKTYVMDNGLTIYPNPAVGGMVNLRAEGMTSPELNVQVLDLTGRVLYTNTFRNDLGNSINEQLNMNLSPGTYLLRTSGGLSATQRLVVVE